MSVLQRLAGALMLELVACAPARDAGPSDADVKRAVDSLIAVAMDAASKADAEGVLSIADPQFSIISGDVMLEGRDTAVAEFRKTYSLISSQHQDVEQSKLVRLGPDVALYTAVGEGTYTDKNGVVSDPVGLGLTVVFVREGGQWHARHAHQSHVQ